MRMRVPILKLSISSYQEMQIPMLIVVRVTATADSNYSIAEEVAIVEYMLFTLQSSVSRSS